MNYAVIFAGGIGSRMGSSVPKQFLEVDGKPILVHVAEKFSSHPLIGGIVIASKEEYIGKCLELIRRYGLKKVVNVIPGGPTGQETIYNGVREVYLNHSANPDRDIVLIHDGVRPLITEELITESIACTERNGNSIAVSNAIETVIRVDRNGTVTGTVDRSECRHAKAPPCFFLKELWEVHSRAKEDGVINAIDTATLMSMYGCKLHTTPCGPENIKITTPGDYYMFQAIYEARKRGEVL